VIEPGPLDAAGILIGLLQIPAFLIVAAALGASSSHVTIGGLIASVFDPSVAPIDYLAKHVAPATLDLSEKQQPRGHGIAMRPPMHFSR
jgi:hypothetical protein